MSRKSVVLCGVPNQYCTGSKYTTDQITRQLNTMAELESVRDLARKLALALADEVAYHGESDSAEASLQALNEARERLDLQDEFDAIDSLIPQEE